MENIFSHLKVNIINTIKNIRNKMEMRYTLNLLSQAISEAGEIQIEEFREKCREI